jgi:tripartite motif-containing protein 71
MKGIVIREKSFLNYHILCRLSIFFIILMTLISSSSLLPAVYSQQELSAWTEFGKRRTTLSWPSGIDLDSFSGDVYIVDTGNNRIKVFSNNGTFITEWGGYGGRADNGTLRFPRGIAVNSWSFSGDVYVADTGNNRIQVFSSNGTFLTRWGGYGGAVENGTLRFPQGIAIDPSTGNVYVADTGNNRIQVFSSNGTFLTRWGGYGTINGTLRTPTDITIDQQGNVYVADTGNNRIQVFSSNGTFLTRWGGYGTGNGSLIQPSGIAVDSEGNVYVADTGNNMMKIFSNHGALVSRWGDYGRSEISLRSPSGITIDPSTGNVYVADTGNNRIQLFLNSTVW